MLTAQGSPGNPRALCNYVSPLQKSLTGSCMAHDPCRHNLLGWSHVVLLQMSPTLVLLCISSSFHVGDCCVHSTCLTFHSLQVVKQPNMYLQTASVPKCCFTRKEGTSKSGLALHILYLCKRWQGWCKFRMFIIDCSCQLAACQIKTARYAESGESTQYTVTSASRSCRFAT